jgi:hypothetical protein
VIDTFKKERKKGREEEITKNGEKRGDSKRERDKQIKSHWNLS